MDYMYRLCNPQVVSSWLHLDLLVIETHLDLLVIETNTIGTHSFQYSHMQVEYVEDLHLGITHGISEWVAVDLLTISGHYTDNGHHEACKKHLQQL